MKNIHLIPTDKPSRLQLNVNTKALILFNNIQSNNESAHLATQNIYITSDEEIKEPCWCWDILQKKIYWVHDTLPKYPTIGNYFKKIILTTDPKLINDSVQGIDDEFLQWFVKNPSCEEIGVLTNNMKNSDYIEVAERLYKYINPTSKMDCPNSVYITTEKWYYEWLNIETDLDLFDWCIKFKISCIIPNFGDVDKYRIAIPKQESKTAWVGVLHDKLNEYHPAEYELKDIYQGEGCLPNFPDEELCQIWCDSKYKEWFEQETTLTSEEFFRKKLKDLNPLQSSVTLSREMITAEQGMIWAKEYSDYINKQEKR